MIKKNKTVATVLGVAVLSLVLAACGSSNNSNTSSSGATGSSTTLVGAGSTLVAPLVSEWQPEYDKKAEVAVTYGAIGSGGGIAQITARTVDFGASDAPLTEDQFKEAKGVVQIPWALAATVVAYHVEGVPNQLKLTGPVLAEIYEGKIKAWNDPAIAKLNPGVSLPSTAITPIHRSDGSGDTFAFTNYLSHISPEWSSKYGHATQVNFPVGVGAKGNSGVGGALTSTNGSIGYIAIAYVLQNKFDYALVQNAAGKYPVPGIPSISAAAATLASVPANNEVSIVDPPASAPGAYPISTFTYALVPESAPKASTLKPFLKWAINEGQSFGAKLEFAPLPAKVVSADEATIEKIS
ncbi:MAG TPA: phosphate ABC transporter substrate-binding protein PstS [Solirubrobacteraceae bacterium]|nr:phosphate ABC transporter substrate-binding protein PstS [Solirubrobacteraceae bacterium]